MIPDIVTLGVCAAVNKLVKKRGKKRNARKIKVIVFYSEVKLCGDSDFYLKLISKKTPYY
jgi:hypothetical protein